MIYKINRPIWNFVFFKLDVYDFVILNNVGLSTLVSGHDNYNFEIPSLLLYNATTSRPYVNNYIISYTFDHRIEKRKKKEEEQKNIKHTKTRHDFANLKATKNRLLLRRHDLETFFNHSLLDKNCVWGISCALTCSLLSFPVVVSGNSFLHNTNIFGILNLHDHKIALT